MRAETGRPRPGVSLVETLAAMTLTGLVLAIVVGTALAQMRLARATARRAGATDAERTIVTVLAGEARRMTAADVTALSADSVRIRAVRGTAIPCGLTPSGILVRYEGDRLPDPSKDSVLILSPPASIPDVLLDSQPAPASCTARPAERVLEWRLGGTAAPGPVLLLFESGSYHLAGGAFRYRVGAGGRQPLTDQSLAHPDSRFTGVSARAILFDLGIDGFTSSYAASFAPDP
ncbi:MAG TPA: hypothetical protein VFZ69_09180 [Longimicrobiales bacterium]